MTVLPRTRPGLSIVVMVAESDKAIYSALARTWDRITAEAPEVPGVVLDLTPGRPSSCTSVGWLDSPPVLEVNLRRDDGSTLTGAELLQIFLHQAAHGITGPVRGQEGRAHGTAYRDAAVSLGLRAEKDSSGYGDTSLAPGTRTRYKSEIAAMDRALARWTPTPQIKSERKARNGVVLECSCTPPRKIRMRGNPETLDASGIGCEICGQPFRLVS